jgi:hypothetical protein
MFELNLHLADLHHIVRVQSVFGGPHEVARPLQDGSWLRRIRATRRCRRVTGHCWHPADEMIMWFCCECGTDTDGMPPKECKICDAMPTPTPTKG